MSSGIFEENGYSLWWTYYDQPLKPEEASAEARKLLQRVLPNEALKLEKSPTGKPFLTDSNLFISISHAPRMVAVVVAPFPVGLDVEAPHSRLLRIKERVFSEKECTWAHEDLRKLSALWTAREALYKLDGNRGLDFRKDLGTEGFDDEILPNVGWIKREGSEARIACLAYHFTQQHLFCVAHYQDFYP